MYENGFKRILDFLISLIGIIILSPLLLILSLIVKLTSKGPILFKQVRVGRNNANFEIMKFRTMKIETPKDCPTHLLDDPDVYITKVGKFLRKSSLDELPQLFNILKGDMSIIGPRPSLPNQTDLNKLRDENGSSSLRPGLSGLAQINGRDELPIEVKAGYDGEYAKRITFFGDFKLFLGTFLSVLKSDGVKDGSVKE